MFKVLLEEPNGLARRIVSKAGSNASRLLDKTEAFINQQPRVSGDSAQVGPCLQHIAATAFYGSSPAHIKDIYIRSNKKGQVWLGGLSRGWEG